MKIKCLLCDSIIEGDKKGTWITCECGKCYIDETSYYCRIGGDPNNIAEQNEKGEWIKITEITNKEDKVSSTKDSKDFYIFLDVDGVLNNENYMDKCYEMNGHHAMHMNHAPFDPKCLKNLMLLCRKLEENNIKPLIILSSTWRLSDVDYEIVDARLAEYGLHLTNKTPRDEDMIRGKEIECYLKDKEFKDFIILDDDSADIISMYPDHLIQTNYKTGFDKKMFNKTLTWLENKKYIKFDRKVEE